MYVRTYECEETQSFFFPSAAASSVIVLFFSQPAYAVCWWHNSPDVIVTLVPTCLGAHWNVQRQLQSS